MAACRSVGPTGLHCVRNSQKGQHMKHSDGRGGYWKQGVTAPAIEVPKSPPVQSPDLRNLRDPDDMTEGEWQAFGRFGY